MADQLVTEPGFQAAEWIAVLSPVRSRLIPELRELFAAESRPLAARNAAAAALAE
ncbi:MAG: hypothetical protein ACJ8C4_09240 [Gemmataceae bacterium]